MLGTSGTVTTIAGVHLRLRRYDRRRVDGCWLSDDEISRVVDELLAMSFDERAANPCIGAERADLVLAGCAILDAIRRALSVSAAARRRSRAARRHAGRDDARRRRLGRGLSGHGPAQGREAAARCRRASGSSASSTIPMCRAPSATAFARAPPTSSPKSTTSIMCSRRARAWSISAPRRAAGARSRSSASGRRGRVIALDILDLKPITGVEFLQLDFLDAAAPDRLKALLGGKADVVLSDMAANATGHRKTDHLRIMALAEAAAAFRARGAGRARLVPLQSAAGRHRDGAACRTQARFRNRQARQAAGEPDRFRGALSAGARVSASHAEPA